MHISRHTQQRPRLGTRRPEATASIRPRTGLSWTTPRQGRLKKNARPPGRDGFEITDLWRPALLTCISSMGASSIVSCCLDSTGISICRLERPEREHEHQRAPRKGGNADGPMDGHSGQPGLASGGSAGRSENLQGGSKGCLLGRPGEVRLPGAHWLSCRCCDLEIGYVLMTPVFAGNSP